MIYWTTFNKKGIRRHFDISVITHTHARTRTYVLELCSHTLNNFTLRLNMFLLDTWFVLQSGPINLLAKYKQNKKVKNQSCIGNNKNT